MRFHLLAGIFLSAVLIGCAATKLEPARPSISIERFGQAPLVIEDDGTKARHSLFILAQELKVLERHILEWEPGPELQPAVVNAMKETMQNERQHALEQLEEAWLATTTRSLKSASAHSSAAGEGLAQVKQALKAPPPSSLYCHTIISSSEPGSRLHYLPEGKFRDGHEDWVSYTEGSNIKIGNYRFKVSAENKTFDERVTIMADPFVHTIQPR